MFVTPRWKQYFAESWMRRPNSGFPERQVVLYTRKEAAKTSPADTPSRKITVRGTVRDAGGNVLIGVSVVEKGTTNGTATDANGLYSIDVKSAEAILTFSYLSYKTVESAVSTRTQLDVTLEEDAARLDDVVIIGYGTQTKASITGALATVDTKELVKAPVASITNGIGRFGSRRGRPYRPPDSRVTTPQRSISAVLVR